MKNFKLIALMLAFALTGINFLEARTYGYIKSDCKRHGKEWRNGKCRDKKKSIAKNISVSIKDQAQQLVDAINDHNTITVMEILSFNHPKLNNRIIEQAMQIVPTYQTFVRCAASNPDCGLSPQGKFLKTLQIFLQGQDKLNKDYINSLFDQYMPIETSLIREEENIIEEEMPMMGSNSTTYAPENFRPASEFKGDGLVGNYFAATQVATIHDPSGKNQQNYSFENVVEMSGYEIDEQAPNGLIFIGSFMRSPRCQKGMMCAQVMTNINLFGKLKNEIPTPENDNQTLDLIRTLPADRPINDDQFFHVGDQNYTAPLRGFRSPNDNKVVGGMRTAVMPQINNNSGQNVTLTFLDEKKSVISTETISARDSILLPRNAKYINLNKSITPIIMSQKYSIVADGKGKVSIKKNQIYF